MKIVKPMKLSLFPRPFEEGGRRYLAVGILGMFPFADPQALHSEAFLWKTFAKEGGADALLDVGNPKPHGEVIVSGAAFAPQGTSVKAMEVEFSVGPVRRRLAVFGDRYFERTTLGWRITEPKPFETMPLDWARAYGGKGFDDNPAGKGFPTDAMKEGKAPWPLPNIENSANLLADTEQRPAPVCPGMVGVAMPFRTKKAGTYDDNWLANVFPALPADADLTIHQAAQPEQWAPGFFEGGESFSFRGMSPDKPLVQGKLPRLVPRLYLKDAHGVRSVETRLETVWLLPGVGKGIVLYRGVTEVVEDDATDITAMLAAFEFPDAPKGDPHYREVFERRLDPVLRKKYALRDEELMPYKESITTILADLTDGEKPKRKKLMSARMKKGNADLLAEAQKGMAEKGLGDLSALTETEPPAPLVKDPIDFDAIEKLTAEMKAKADLATKEAMDKVRGDLGEKGIDIDAAMAAGGAPSSPGKSLSAVRAQMKKAATALKELAGKAKIEGAEAAVDLEDMFAQQEKGILDGYRKYAHRMSAPAKPKRNDADARSLKETFLDRIAAGGTTADLELEHAPFAQLRASGRNLAGLYLDSADLRDADLRGADLTGAILTRADLTGADLTGANLTMANIGSAILKKTRFDAADMTDAVLGTLKAEECSFTGATMTGADLLQSSFVRCDFARATLPEKTLFFKVSLAGTSFAGCVINKGVFHEVDLTGADFTGATTAKTVFIKTKAAGATFAKATLVKGLFSLETDLTGADFTGAAIERINLIRATLVDAKFTGAKMDRADLSEANIARGDFTDASAVGARFRKSDLTDAKMTGMNMMDGSLHKAILAGADLSRCNLFQVEFLRTVVDDKTKFNGANIDRTKLKRGRA